MSLTVSDCLKLPSLRSAKVIAGHKGLSNIVNNVSVLEIYDAELFSLEAPVNDSDMTLLSQITMSCSASILSKCTVWVTPP